METPGERIRQLRVMQGLSQRDVAMACMNVTVGYLSRIETDHSVPSRRAMAEIASALHTTALWIEHGDGPMVCPHCHSELTVSML